VSDTDAAILSAVLSAQSVAIIGLAVSIARTREKLARVEAQIEDLWKAESSVIGRSVLSSDRGVQIIEKPPPKLP